MLVDSGAKLAKLQQDRTTNLALILSPLLARMPLPMQRYDEPFLPFGKAIIDATHDLARYLVTGTLSLKGSLLTQETRLLRFFMDHFGDWIMRIY